MPRNQIKNRLFRATFRFFVSLSDEAYFCDRKLKNISSYPHLYRLLKKLVNEELISVVYLIKKHKLKLALTNKGKYIKERIDKIDKLLEDAPLA